VGAVKPIEKRSPDLSVEPSSLGLNLVECVKKPVLSLAATDLVYLDSLPYSATVAVASQSPISTDALSGRGSTGFPGPSTIQAKGATLFPTALEIRNDHQSSNALVDIATDRRDFVVFGGAS